MNIEDLPSLTGAFIEPPQVSKLYNLERTQAGAFQYLPAFGIEFDLIFDQETRISVDSYVSHLTEQMAENRLAYQNIEYRAENSPENNIVVTVTKER